MRTRSTAVLAIALATFVLAGCGEGDVESGSDEVTVELSELMDSGQTGTATLTAEGNQTRVFIEIDGDPVSPLQPAHIHEGTCDELTPEPAYGLPNVNGGRSDATVDATLDSLIEGEYAINLHFSPDDLEAYTSCGNI